MMKTTNGKQSRVKRLKGALIVRMDVLLVALGGGEAALCTRSGRLMESELRFSNDTNPDARTVFRGKWRLREIARNDTEIGKGDN
jgi:hypothetical protein